MTKTDAENKAVILWTATVYDAADQCKGTHTMITLCDPSHAADWLKNVTGDTGELIGIGPDAYRLAMEKCELDNGLRAAGLIE
jgi:hypothetical protein